MADLRDLLHRSAPHGPEFDPDDVERRIARRTTRRHVAFAAGVCIVAAAVAIGLSATSGSSPHTVVVAPSTTTPNSTQTTVATSTTTTTPRRPTVAPVQTSPMPAEAFVSLGSTVVAVDTHDPTQRRTVATFPDGTGVSGLRLDGPHDRLFFTVTSGCDPGLNGMYDVPTAGGTPRKLSSLGSTAVPSPDGTRIAYSVHTDGCGSRDLVVQDVASGQQTRFTGTRSIDVGGWSADGQSLFIWAYTGSDPTVYRFRPFEPGAQLDRAERWDTGIASDAGSGRVAILDWCTGDTIGSCVVGIRTRPETGNGPDYSFGHVANVDALSVDASGQWPLIVSENPPGQVVSYYAAGAWHRLAEGGSADW